MSRKLLSILFLIALLTGCTNPPAAVAIVVSPTNTAESITSPVSQPATSTFTLTSTAVADGGRLPVEYTCDGNGSTLPLAWSGAPADTKSFAVIMHHEAQDGIHWYWVLYNIPATVTSLPKDVSGIGTLGNNINNGLAEYSPPCSKGPADKTYTYTVYALSAKPQISVPAEQVTRDVLLTAIQTITLAFLLLSLIVIGLAVALIWGLISVEFNKYLEVQRENEFAVAAKNYYLAHHTWDGVDSYLREQQLLPPLDEVNPPPQPFVLVDKDRKVIIASAPYVVGEKVKQGTLDKGVPIESNGEVFGTVVSTGQPLVRKPIDQKYVDQINRGFWLAGLFGMLVALGFGLLLARSLTRPMRDLTAATRDMAQGKLEQRVVVRSNDELGELAQAFNQMSADLAKSYQARKQMTADIAHDLRNPLTVLSGYLESLQDGKLNPTQERFATMHAEVRHLQRLVDDLRTLSLADAGELKLQLELTSIPELLGRVAEAYRPQAEQNQIDLKVEVEPDLPVVNLDSARMEQVLGNLVSNSLRYTPQGGKIQLSAKQVSGSLTVSIKDNGSGIPAEVLPHIFERSFRGDESRSGDGTGLGLAIVKSIVKLHRGEIRAESDKTGSHFFITF